MGLLRGFNSSAMASAGDDRPAQSVLLREQSGRSLRSFGLRALVIDDSDTARTQMSLVLRRADFRVYELPSAIGATRIALREQIDVAVIDISMPGLSGDKLVSVFRSNARLKAMVIIVVSGHAEDHLGEVAKNPEVDGVLPKSKIQGQLVPLVQRLVTARRLETP